MSVEIKAVTSNYLLYPDWLTASFEWEVFFLEKQLIV